MKTTSTVKTTPKMETCKNVRCIIYYLKNLLMTPHLDRHSKADPKPEMLSAVSKLKIEFDIMKEMYAELGMRICLEKTTF